MTFLDKYMAENEVPVKDGTKARTGYPGCPSDYGYEKPFDCDLDCGYCWTREVKKDVD